MFFDRYIVRCSYRVWHFVFYNHLPISSFVYWLSNLRPLNFAYHAVVVFVMNSQYLHCSTLIVPQLQDWKFLSHYYHFVTFFSITVSDGKFHIWRWIHRGCHTYGGGVFLWQRAGVMKSSMILDNVAKKITFVGAADFSSITIIWHISVSVQVRLNENKNLVFCLWTSTWLPWFDSLWNREITREDHAISHRFQLIGYKLKMG